MISKFGNLENVTNKFLRASAPNMPAPMSPLSQPLAPLKAMTPIPEMMKSPLGQPQENALVRGLDDSFTLHANLNPSKHATPRTISEKSKISEKRRYPSQSKQFVVVDQ